LIAIFRSLPVLAVSMCEAVMKTPNSLLTNVWHSG